MSSAPEQQLLYQLRSPTLPLNDKLQLITSAFNEQSSTSTSPLAQLVRDWIIDLLLKSRQQHISIILSAPCWSSLARACTLAPSTSSSPSLPAFVAFLQAYAASDQVDADLVESVSTSWSKLATAAMRKAAVDAALSGTAALLKSTVQVLQRDGSDCQAWQKLFVVWLQAFRGVLDLGKAGKKVPQQTLAQLPSILSLLNIPQEHSPIRQSLLDTVKLALFNVENLRRGIARESYHAGSADATSIMTNRDDGGDGAAGELLAALESFTGDETLVHATIPVFTSLYFSALADHATTLFPLPAKNSNFPTASAARSALEIHSLQKRRALAASWTRGVATLVGWQQEEDDYQKELLMQSESTSSSKVKSELELDDPSRAQALASVLQAVEKDDLHRDGPLEGWSGTLEFLADFALNRLAAKTTSESREPLLAVLASIMRLSFRSLDNYVPRLLASLASTPAPPMSSAASVLLGDLLHYHERSVTLPTLLHQLSTALAGAATSGSPPNSLLTAHAFFSIKLEHSIGSMGSSGAQAAQSCFESLLRAAELQPPIREAEGHSAAADNGDTVDSDGRSLKRRKVSPEPGRSGVELNGRLRVLAAFVRGVPSRVLPTTSLERVQRDFVLPALRKLAAGSGSSKDKRTKRKGKGTAEEARQASDVVEFGEWLELAFAMRARVVSAGVDESADWKLDIELATALRARLEASDVDGHSVVSLTQLLLQGIELGDFSAAPDVVQEIITSVLTLCENIKTASGDAWNGLLRSISRTHVPFAVWEAVTRRWMPTISHHASPPQLDSLALLIVKTMNGKSASSLTPSGSTIRMLRRADLYELRDLQAPLNAAIVSLVTLVELDSPTVTLGHVKATKPPKALRSLDPSEVETGVEAFSRITSLIPLEYLGKSLRGDLVDRALSLDLWVSSAHYEGHAGPASSNTASLFLRRFVVVALASSQGLSASSAVLFELLERTTDDAMVGTLEMYRLFVRSVIQSYRSDKNDALLVQYIEAFNKPFSGLSKRFKHGTAPLTCEEQALSILYESLATTLGSFKDLPAALSAAIASSVTSARKSFGKAVAAAQKALESDNAVIFEFAGLLNACKAMWIVQSWVGNAAVANEVDDYATFAEEVLGALLRRLRLRMLPPPQALATALALLDLLRLRMDQMRAIAASPDAVAVAPFEAFVACHVSIGSSLGSIDGSHKSLEANLKQAATAASLREYEAALSSLSEAIQSAVGPEEYSAGGVSASLGPTLRVALVVLRDGPEGSSRLSGNCLSAVLRHLSAVLSRYGPGHREQGGEAVARLYLQISQFVESICGERPMLLSRMNVSSVLSMVSRMLQPMGSTAASSDTIASPTPPEVASALMLSLVSIVSHLVQHRKDHISPLFAHLVATLAGFTGVLRRGGYGTTGSGSIEEDGDVAVGLGKRAERDARATFPFWAWEGGSDCVSRAEGKAVGRLLGSLAAKTASTLKRKHGSDEQRSEAATAAGATTVSLVAPLSKHAPFIILPYLRGCAHPTCPIPFVVRKEMQGGWFEVMDAMGKWERESLMTAFLGSNEETERAVLRAMWKGWEKERYKGN